MCAGGEMAADGAGLNVCIGGMEGVGACGALPDGGPDEGNLLTKDDLSGSVDGGSMRDEMDGDALARLVILTGDMCVGLAALELGRG